MSYCQGCGRQIHESATSCPQCGATVRSFVAPQKGTAMADGTLWLPVPAFICSLIPVLSMLGGNAQWSEDQSIGALAFAICALVLGGVSLARQRRAKGLAISALILGFVGLLCALGSLS